MVPMAQGRISKSMKAANEIWMTKPDVVHKIRVETLKSWSHQKPEKKLGSLYVGEVYIIIYFLFLPGR